MAASGRGRPRDALGPRHSTAPFKKQGRKGRGHHAEASSEPSSSASLLLAQDDEPAFPRGRLPLSASISFSFILVSLLVFLSPVGRLWWKWRGKMLTLLRIRRLGLN